MKRLLTILPAAVLLLSPVCLTGCGAYASSYRAIGLIRSNAPDSAFLSFLSLEGRIVFTLKCGDGAEGIRCTGKLESGEAVVYYDRDGEKKELFTIRGGEEFNVLSDSTQPGTVRFIVETEEKCRNGEFSFRIE